MRVTVFGATTPTGRAVVERALDAGHEVTVLARDNTEYPTSHERLTVLEGDVQDVPSVERAVRTADAVVTAFAEPLPHLPGVDNADAMHNVVRTLAEYRADRLVAVVGSDEPARSGIRGRIERYLTVGGERKAGEQESTVRGSGLDWTIVRPSELTDGPATGEYRVDADPDAPLSRADLADFVVSLLDDGEASGRAVSVSGPES